MSEKIFVAKEATSQEILSKVNALSAEKPKRYGYKIDLNNSDPATRVSYMYDAVGITPVTAVPSSGGQPNLGGWADKWFVTKNHACILNAAGVEECELNPTDYTKTVRNTPSGLTIVDGRLSAPADFLHNVMAAIPRVYVKRWMEDGYQCVSICEEKYDEDYEALAHIDSNGIEQPYAYLAAFDGWVDSNGKLRSIPNKIPSTQGDTANTSDAHDTAHQMQWAAAVGTDFTITPWSLWTLVGDLLILMAKNTNTQAVYGQGYTTGGSSRAQLRASGDTAGAGAFWGNSVATTSFVKVFHIENFWGHIWKRAAGLLSATGGKYYAQMNQKDGPYAYTIANSHCNVIGYAGSHGMPGGGAGNYFTRFNTGRYGTLPLVQGNGVGSDASYECDYHYYNNSQENVAILGGGCHRGSGCGARYVHLSDTAAHTHWYIGAALAKV